jgi:hypothetical protein
MSNLSYCRFRNTSIDLEECQKALEEEDLKILSKEERRAARQLILICTEIATDFGNYREE